MKSKKNLIFSIVFAILGFSLIAFSTDPSCTPAEGVLYFVLGLFCIFFTAYFIFKEQQLLLRSQRKETIYRNLVKHVKEPSKFYIKIKPNPLVFKYNKVTGGVTTLNENEELLIPLKDILQVFDLTELLLERKEEEKKKEVKEIRCPKCKSRHVILDGKTIYCLECGTPSVIS